MHLAEGPRVTLNQLPNDSAENRISIITRIERVLTILQLDVNVRIRRGRVRGDQITHGIEGLDSAMFFKYKTDNRTRGHSGAFA